MSGAGVDEDQADGVDEDQADDVVTAGDLLTDEERVVLDALADMLAARLLGALTPGLGPMIIPADVARVIACGRGWHNEWMVAPGADDMRMETRCLPDGSLALSLTWQGGQPVWSGVLRPA